VVSTTVTVTYFAALVDATGCRSEDLAVPDRTVAGLRAAVGQRHGPRAAALVRLSSVLTGDEVVRHESAAIGPVVDLLPPFAGG
jgi:molybdopterin converting factor small subunit